MTRHEAIKLALQIKREPAVYTDYSTYLYEAVGLIKREPDSGAILAAQMLVDAIKEAAVNLSNFCRRRIEIIEEAHMKNMCRNLEVLAKAQEMCDYNFQRSSLYRS